MSWFDERTETYVLIEDMPDQQVVELYRKLLKVTQDQYPREHLSAGKPWERVVNTVNRSRRAMLVRLAAEVNRRGLLNV